MEGKRILFLVGPKPLSVGMKSQLNVVLRQFKMSMGDFHELCLSQVVSGLYVETTQKKSRRTVFKPTKDKDILANAKATLDLYISKLGINFIIICDPAMLGIIDGENTSLDNCRGSVYYYRGITAICVNDPQQLVSTNEGKWIAVNDFAKVKRFIDGKPRPEPKFEYKICRSLSDVAEAETFLTASPIIAIDSETRDDWIKCIQYTGIVAGRVFTYVIPFFNPTRPNCAHWDTEEEEIETWKAVRRIHTCPAFKVFQNGSYDNSYFIKWHCPVTNWFFDTAHMWHCIYAELPKRLDFIASICVDHYRFWKEEANVEKSSLDTASAADKLERFWRYGALDTYFTFCGVQVVLQLMMHKDYAWSIANYHMEFSLQVGPCMAMMCRGIKRDREQWLHFKQLWEAKREKALHKCRVITADPEFNPGSPPQVAEFFYEVLGAQKQKVGKSDGGTDEMTLKRFGEQHKLFAMCGNAILEYREATKVVSSYINYYQRRGRVHYSMNAAATDTSRFGSGTFMWEGINGQTIPDHLRSMYVADNGWLLFDIDLEQSDARYMAYESQDETFIANVESGKDTHCLHAAHFFKEPYEVIVEKVKAGIPRYADKQTGIRAATKKVVHGTNYIMRENTLYLTMVKDLGREAVINAIETAFGLNNAQALPQKTVLAYLKQIQESYHKLYPRLRPFYKWVADTIRKTGKTVTAFGWTRIIFGNPDDDATIRAAVAGYGQGDTAGNINRAVGLLYYGGEYNGKVYDPIDGENLKLLLQCHDSLMGLVRPSHAHLLLKVAELMELPIRIRDREMRVPASIAIGFRWGDKNLKKPSRIQLQEGTWRELFDAR